jgi:hypothetical protein
MPHANAMKLKRHPTLAWQRDCSLSSQNNATVIPDWVNV